MSSSANWTINFLKMFKIHTLKIIQQTPEIKRSLLICTTIIGIANCKIIRGFFHHYNRNLIYKESRFHQDGATYTSRDSGEDCTGIIPRKSNIP